MVFLGKKSKEMEITTFSKLGGPTLLISEDLIYKSKSRVVHILRISVASMKQTVCERDDIKYLSYSSMIFPITMRQLEIH